MHYTITAKSYSIYAQEFFFLSFFFAQVVPHTREVVNSDIPATDYINYERASYETDQMPR